MDLAVLIGDKDLAGNDVHGFVNRGARSCWTA
jgi:hypothetical protein